VPSLLRGFSAPVVLDDGLPTPTCWCCCSTTRDPFNRWEAGQRLALNRLLAAIGRRRPLELDDAFIEAMRAVLRHPRSTRPSRTWC
jgi:aminopeptidase N